MVDASAITLRQGQPGDEAALALVASASFLETFAGIIPGPDLVQHCATQSSAGKFAGWIADANSCVWTAEHGATKAPVGYAVLTTPDLPDVETRADDAELKRIYILSRYHGGGLAARMMDAAIAATRNMGKARLLLGVYGGNDRAIAFYRKCGFAVVGTRRFRVGNAWFDDLIMGRAI